MPALETISTPAVAEAVAHLDLDTNHPGSDRVGVALESDKARGADGVVGLDRRRVARARKGTEPLEPGQVRHGRAPSLSCGEERRDGIVTDELLQLGDRAGPAVRDLLAEPVELCLGLGYGLGGHRPPETLGGEVDGLLDGPLPVAPMRRTGDDADSIVLGDREEARLDDTGLRVDDRCHAVGPPTPGSAPESAQHPVECLDEVRLVL
jgi:hypothetical protein